jgi:hypothetical protein
MLHCPLEAKYQDIGRWYVTATLDACGPTPFVAYETALDIEDAQSLRDEASDVAQYAAEPGSLGRHVIIIPNIVRACRTWHAALFPGSFAYDVSPRYMFFVFRRAAHGGWERAPTQVRAAG